MFIVSVKPKKKTVIIVSAIVAAVILLIIGITVLSTAPANANGEKGSYSLEVDGNAGRIEFLEQFGWKTSGKATKTEKLQSHQNLMKFTQAIMNFKNSKV